MISFSFWKVLNVSLVMKWINNDDVGARLLFHLDQSNTENHTECTDTWKNDSQCF